MATQEPKSTAATVAAPKPEGAEASMAAPKPEGAEASMDTPEEDTVVLVEETVTVTEYRMPRMEYN
jgi:hypothetical protein